MANSNAICTQFKRDLLKGLHALGTSVVRAGTSADTIKGALFLSSASRGELDTVYTTTGELAGTGNYTQGGVVVTNATEPTTSGTTAYWTPSAALTWTNLTSSGPFDALVLYNDTSASKLQLGCFTFGETQITSGNLTITFPSNTSSTALIRIA